MRAQGPVKASCSPSAGPTSIWTGLRCISRLRSQTVGAAGASSASRRRDPIGGMSRLPRQLSTRSGGKRRDGANLAASSRPVRSTSSPLVPMDRCRCGRIRSAIGGLRPGELQSLSSSTFSITRRRQCSTPASPTVRSPTSSATASPRSGFTTTAAPTSVSERRSGRWNSDRPTVVTVEVGALSSLSWMRSRCWWQPRATRMHRCQPTTPLAGAPTMLG